MLTSTRENPRKRRIRHRRGKPVAIVGIGGVELYRTGLSRFDAQDPYAFAVTLSWRDFVLSFLGAETVINTVFALLYPAVPGAVTNLDPPGFVGAFFFSLETLATVGYGDMYPGNLYGHAVSAVEILTEVIFTAIMPASCSFASRGRSRRSPTRRIPSSRSTTASRR